MHIVRLSTNALVIPAIEMVNELLSQSDTSQVPLIPTTMISKIFKKISDIYYVYIATAISFIKETFVMNIPNYLYSIIHGGKQYFFTMGDLHTKRMQVNKLLQESGNVIVPLRLKRFTDLAATYEAKDGWRVIATIQ